MKKLVTLIALASLAGCASSRFAPLQESEYTYYSDFLASSEKCFVEDKFEPELLGKVSQKLGTVLSIRDYDHTKLMGMYKNKFDDMIVTESSCKTARAYAQNIIEHGSRIEKNQAAQISKSTTVIPQPGKPVWCNSVGTIVMCN